MPTDQKTVVLATAVLLASWLMSDATSRPHVAGSVPPLGASRDATHDLAIDRLSTQVSEETARLRTHMSEPSPPRRSGRDPFRFGAARPPLRRTVASGAAERAAAEVAAPVPPVPPVPFRLIGIAENAAVAGAVERRAILSGDGRVVIVGIDESVGTRFLVVAIGADAVELFDATTNQPLRLTLR